MAGIDIKSWWDHPLSRLVVMGVISGFLIVLIHMGDLASHWYAIPLALLSASVVGYFFEAYEFRKFLEDRILEVFIKDEYLKKLNAEKLEGIQDKIYQIYYNILDRPTEKSLYQFVKTNILTYLDKPFKQSFEAVWDLYYDKEGTYFKAVCKQSYLISTLKNEKIKDEVPILLIVKKVPEKSNEEIFPFDEWYLRVNGNGEEFKDLKKYTVEEEGSKLKFSYPLQYTVSKDSPVTIQHKTVGLEIEEERVIHFIFKLPTEGFKITVNVHDFGDCWFDYKFSGSIPLTDKQIIKNKRRFEVNYDKWMLPNNSITVYFKPLQNQKGK
jgi:hypothetical protein